MYETVIKALASPHCYVTGGSALCLPSNEGFPALWYSSSLEKPDRWQLAGVQIQGAWVLIGDDGIWDASEILLPYLGGEHTILAANHERAVFDLMFHFCHLRRSAIPNFCFSDIDDVVERRVISDWINSNKLRLDPFGVRLMERWLDS